MDLRQALITILALVASTSGFLPTRNIRPRLIHRQSQRRYPQISMVTNLSKNPSRRPTPPSGGQHTGINQKFTLKSRPRNSGAINIISNIILQHPSNKPATPNQRHQNMPGQQNPAQGHGRRGQGRGPSSRQHRQGQRAGPYTVFNGIGGGIGGAHTGHPGIQGQQTHGRSPVTDFGTFHGSRHSGNRPLVGGAGQHSTGSQAGHGPQAQLTLPLMNRTDFLAFFQSIKNSNNSSAGAMGNNPSHIVLLPQGSNARAVVLSASPGMGFSGIASKSGHGGAFVVAGGSNHGSNLIMTTVKTPGAGFGSMSTLKPGEDPPEIEHPSA